MQCPVDNTTLVMSERSGVEIDYCPTCRGVWLDRGELDKILDRAAGEQPEAHVTRPRQTYAPEPVTDKRSGGILGKVSEAVRDRDDDRREGYDQHGRKKKKRESFLDDLFDF